MKILKLLGLSLVSYTDEELMVLIQQQHKAAFETLYARYFVNVYAFYLYKVKDKAQASDLTQDLFLRLYQKACLFDANRTLKAWLWTMARNLLVDHYKSAEIAHAPLYVSEDLELPVDETEFSAQEALLIEKTSWDKIVHCLAELKSEHRQILEKSLFDEMSLKDLEIEFKLSIAHLKTIIHRSRKLLLACFERGEKHE